MEAILKTTGPVSTTRAVKHTKMSLSSSNTQQFVEAATELEKANFGKLMSIKNKTELPLQVFVKKLPAEVEEQLRRNPELCTADVYAARYNKGVSKAIGFPLRAKLVAMKLVSQNHFM